MDLQHLLLHLSSSSTLRYALAGILDFLKFPRQLRCEVVDRAGGRYIAAFRHSPGAYCARDKRNG
jgi:hypothetical protein